jgi:uncharacterized protein (UPF0333 family)
MSNSVMVVKEKEKFLKKGKAQVSKNYSLWCLKMILFGLELGYLRKIKKKNLRSAITEIECGNVQLTTAFNQ